jgi:hypothetical protein
VSISEIFCCAFSRLTALSANCWGTESAPEVPPERAVAVALICLEKVSIMVRKESAASPFHEPLSPASALA